MVHEEHSALIVFPFCFTCLGNGIYFFPDFILLSFLQRGGGCCQLRCCSILSIICNKTSICCFFLVVSILILKVTKVFSQLSFVVQQKQLLAGFFHIFYDTYSAIRKDLFQLLQLRQLYCGANMNRNMGTKL